MSLICKPCWIAVSQTILKVLSFHLPLRSSAIHNILQWMKIIQNNRLILMGWQNWSVKACLLIMPELTAWNIVHSAIFVPMGNRPYDTERSVSPTGRNGYTEKMFTRVYFRSIQGKTYDMVTDSNGILNGPNCNTARLDSRNNAVGGTSDRRLRRP